ncbi:MAG TPA: RecX family transcriptional regulator [Bacillota bacterium]|nr:RecX family transcriptional regulator [Bacillota bacterium]HPF42236.1 RecX family transcriptional regulator [Bacillota bacterium]HPJ85742.1 RecX family transcriptional regulator [Bacillota bacterium]HPQ61621.1 RecX family transcriptional regulator [Bacillota bacterium]HRX91528.1 RecX family transcriptional regulator [Candidatus Izemoplasmatales bacterium]
MPATVNSLKKKNNKYIVSISTPLGKDKEYVVSEDLVVEYRLVKSKILSPDDYAIFLDVCEFDRFFQKAKHWLLFQPRSLSQTREYLEKAGASDSLVEKTIAKLREKHLLDDDDFACRYALILLEDKRFGQRRIAFELAKKGFDPESIKLALFEINHDTIYENMNYLFEKKLPTLGKSSLNAAILTMKHHLGQKGYEASDIQDIMAKRKGEFNQFIDEKKQIEKDYRLVKAKYLRKDLPEAKRRDLTIQALLRKGYSYELIKETVERG